ncbi:MAG: DUF167 domain-containing protein [Verrucomicrobia bacterium]|nr:DUF167 domain-containing protein [Leptolyngbya sp. ES-bin-22]
MSILSVKVKPNARQQAMLYEDDGSLTVQLKASPVDGKANQELIQLLAEAFDVPKASVRIKTGSASKLKRIEIDR